MYNKLETDLAWSATEHIISDSSCFVLLLYCITFLYGTNLAFLFNGFTKGILKTSTLYFFRNT